MASAKAYASGTIVAEPQPITLDWSKTALVVIDMQRDFMEPGGFGETLGNDVSHLARAVRPIAFRAGGGARDNGILVIHTREGHLPDLSDAPSAKIESGAPSLRIGGGLGVTPPVALAYVVVAAILYGLAKLETVPVSSAVAAPAE